MINKALQLHPHDNVAVALRDLSAGESITLQNQEYPVMEEIPAKHKFALQDLNQGNEIRMYGELVGLTTKKIAAGMAITLDNIRHKAAEYHLNSGNYEWTPLPVNERTFQGYLRDDGQVGTANYWLVFPLVFCENQNIQTLQEAFELALGYRPINPYVELILSEIHSVENLKKDKKSEVWAGKTTPFSNIDGVRFITHQLGCGGTRQDAETLCRLLAGYVNHPNVAGATILSLGCQNAEFSILTKRLNEIQKGKPKPIIYCDQQQLGTTETLLHHAVSETVKGLKAANEITRTPQSISKLVIGLECGGSDGFSGISANPTLGRVSDLVISAGGSAILSEFPELCGAEQNLINRCESQESAKKFMSLMQTYNTRAEAVGSGFDMNPSPGNIKDACSRMQLSLWERLKKAVKHQFQMFLTIQNT